MDHRGSLSDLSIKEAVSISGRLLQFRTHGCFWAKYNDLKWRPKAIDDGECKVNYPELFSLVDYSNLRRFFVGIASKPTCSDHWVTRLELFLRRVSDVSADEISQNSFPAERRIPPAKLLLIERYVVARK